MTVVTQQKSNQLLQRSKLLIFQGTNNARKHGQVMYQESAQLIRLLVACQVSNGDHDVGLDAHSHFSCDLEDWPGSAAGKSPM